MNNLKETKESKESPYVHRYSAYIHSLKFNWAYVNTNRTPGIRMKEQRNSIEFPSFFVQKNKTKSDM